MTAITAQMGEWIVVDNYAVRVHELKDEIVFDSGAVVKKHVRSVRIRVEYRNDSTKSFKFTLTQWLFFDTSGFTSDYEIRNQFYADDVSRKLREGMLAPGMKAQGWVACQIPKDAVLSHVQFRPNYSSKHLANITFNDAMPRTALPTTAQKSPTQAPQKNAFSRLRQWTRRVTTSKPENTPIAAMEAATSYTLLKPITDHFDNTFLPGQQLKFVKQYPPYHGLHIIIFDKATLYLHADRHGRCAGRKQLVFSIGERTVVAIS